MPDTVVIENPEEKPDDSATQVAAVVTEAEHHAKEEGKEIGALEQCVNQLVQTVNGVNESLQKLQEQNQYLETRIKEISDDNFKTYERINALENVTETPPEETTETPTAEPAAVEVVETPPIEEVEIVEAPKEEVKEEKPKKRFFI